jgi:hypothetical protein
MAIMNLVTPKAGAKRELLFNKLASDIKQFKILKYVQSLFFNFSSLFLQPNKINMYNSLAEELFLKWKAQYS